MWNLFASLMISLPKDLEVRLWKDRSKLRWTESRWLARWATGGIEPWNRLQERFSPSCYTEFLQAWLSCGWAFHVPTVSMIEDSLMQSSDSWWFFCLVDCFTSCFTWFNNIVEKNTNISHVVSPVKLLGGFRLDDAANRWVTKSWAKMHLEGSKDGISKVLQREPYFFYFLLITLWLK